MKTVKFYKQLKTDKDGKISIYWLENGTYKVEFETPSGYTQLK